MLAIPLIIVIVLLQAPEQPETVRVSLICGGTGFAVLAWLAEWMYVSVHYSRSVNAYFFADTIVGVVIIALIYLRRKTSTNLKNQD